MTETRASSSPGSPPGNQAHPGCGAIIGARCARLRDALAAGLVAAGVSPNALTVAGLVFTCGAAVCLVRGAGHEVPWRFAAAATPTSWWPSLSAGLLLLAFAADILDGAVARRGRRQTNFGALLDSTLDRCGDLAIFGGCALHFAWTGNVTYVALSLSAAAGAVLISYVKARAENMVNSCGVGAWQRPERSATILLGAILGHLPAALAILAALPWLTVWRRVRHARDLAAGRPPWTPPGRLPDLMVWRHPRGSVGYDLWAAAVILCLLVAPEIHPFFRGAADPLRAILDGWSGVPR